MAAPAIDGIATAVQASSASAITSGLLTTTQSNDFICVIVGAEDNGTLPSVTSVTGGGLSFSRRSRATIGSQSTELWWAVAPSALSGVAFTANISPGYDDADIFAFGVSGTGLAWDANVSLPAIHYNTDGVYNATASTNSADTLVLAFTGSQGVNLPSGTTPVWLTGEQTMSNGGAVLYEYAQWAAGTPGAVLTSAVVGWTPTGNPTIPTTTTVDAIATAINTITPPSAAGIASGDVPAVYGDVRVAPPSATASAVSSYPEEDIHPNATVGFIPLLGENQTTVGSIPPPPSGVTGPLASGAVMAYGGQSNGCLELSTNGGSTWTKVPGLFDNDNLSTVIDVEWVPFLNLYVATGWRSSSVTALPSIATSLDAIAWGECRSDLDSYTGNGGFGERVRSNGSMVIVVGGGGNTGQASLVTTTDGVTWTNRHTSIFDNPGWVDGIDWNGSEWMAVGTDGSNLAAVATSPDGITWTRKTTPAGITGQLGDVAWSAVLSKWVTVSVVSPGHGVALMSTDGVTWTSSTISSLNNGYTVGDANGALWVCGQAVGGGEAAAFTTDGTTWTPVVLPSCVEVQDPIVYHTGTYWAAGGGFSAGVWKSTDGTTWTAVTDVLYPTGSGGSAQAYGMFVQP